MFRRTKRGHPYKVFQHLSQTFAVDLPTPSPIFTVGLPTPVTNLYSRPSKNDPESSVEFPMVLKPLVAFPRTIGVVLMLPPLSTRGLNHRSHDINTNWASAGIKCTVVYYIVMFSTNLLSLRASVRAWSSIISPYAPLLYSARLSVRTIHTLHLQQETNPYHYT
ncbi:hypothetical protein P167DRAFT_537892 [Morchella conica CCBAS932]|uniref:Uncharacterized protein n=1 Tax=Morchella conica CCBAS932 TaxID=1392247 RepID=A0A3N4KI73_9PEZI|nr:hypothetical protein P167DRAFT_537892 [Morchella conica CCBAS932]